MLVYSGRALISAALVDGPCNGGLDEGTHVLWLCVAQGGL